MINNIPKFNGYTIIRGDKNSTEIVPEAPAYSTLYNNLFNIINSKKLKEEQKKEEPDYVTIPKPEQEVNSPYRAWEDWQKPYLNKYGDKYTMFNVLLEDALSKRQEQFYKTPEFKRFITQLAEKESSFRPNIKNGEHWGYFQLNRTNRKDWTDVKDQFDDMFSLMSSNYNDWMHGLNSNRRKAMQDKGFDIYGLLAGSWLGGTENAFEALDGISNKSDGNDTINDRFRTFTQLIS